MNDTIAAISTAFGEAAVALIRVSGPHATQIAGALWKGRTAVPQLPARVVNLGVLEEGGQKLDDVLLTVFRAPSSYTGEDVVEIACHGGVLVARRILEALLRVGARAAEPGEFTQRAYLNGKLDLTQAEAVMDVIGAQTDLALRAATEQLSGRLGRRIHALRQQIIEALAHIEAFIDFPDEDIDPDTDAALRGRLNAALAETSDLLATAGQGKVLREGVRTVIFGEPNVGKSSLLNLLLGYERAIVSARPGTTRDILEETIALAGIPLRLVDTAGVRDTGDELEQAGIGRTHQALETADLVLHVIDASVAMQPGWDHLPAGQRARRMIVLNKCDLGVHSSWMEVGEVRMSCVDGTGLDTLTIAITEAVLGGAATHDWSAAINARHASCIERAVGFLRAALAGMDEGLSPEFIAEELRAALDAVGDIVGPADSDEVLGVIFSRFCIGK